MGTRLRERHIHYHAIRPWKNKNNHSTSFNYSAKYIRYKITWDLLSTNKGTAPPPRLSSMFKESFKGLSNEKDTLTIR